MLHFFIRYFLVLSAFSFNFCFLKQVLSFVLLYLSYNKAQTPTEALFQNQQLVLIVLELQC